MGKDVDTCRGRVKEWHESVRGIPPECMHGISPSMIDLANEELKNQLSLRSFL
jgi:hypothetical protein